MHFAVRLFPVPEIPQRKTPFGSGTPYLRASGENARCRTRSHSFSASSPPMASIPRGSASYQVRTFSRAMMRFFSPATSTGSILRAVTSERA